jgi:hypothetical protein
MADRQRQNFKANFRGMNTRDPADAMPPGKFPLGQNVRAEGDSKIRTRPGYKQIFTTGTGGPITDLGSYTTLGTDNKTRILAHDQAGHVYLDDQQNKGTVGTGGLGASIIPFRPAQSPQSWAYVANATGYSKFSAPDSQNNVTQQKVGIAEPQTMPEAVPEGFEFNEFTGTAGNWFASGPLAGVGSGPPVAGAGLTQVIRSTSTVIGMIEDPTEDPNMYPTPPPAAGRVGMISATR